MNMLGKLDIILLTGVRLTYFMVTPERAQYLTNEFADLSKSSTYTVSMTPTHDRPAHRATLPQCTDGA